MSATGRVAAGGVSVRGHAKINLDLRVLGVRPDGYHELRTVFQSVALHDVVDCAARPGPFELTCDTPGVPLDASNLVWKAAQRLWEALERPGAVRDTAVHLTKQIPMQAGLGGGSADAAAALIGLARLWKASLKPAQLADVAAGIGADVPFFLSGGTALGLGRGDEIYPLVDLPRHWVVLVTPAFGVSTQEAYGWYDTDWASGTLAHPEPQFVPGPWPSRAAQMVNDLEPPLAQRHPEIARMRAALLAAGAAAASMTGSGSTVFGLFQRKAQAAAAARTLQTSGWTVCLTHSLGRAEYAVSARPRRTARR